MSQKNKDRLAMLKTPSASVTNTPVQEQPPTPVATRSSGVQRRSLLATQDNPLGRMASGKQRVVQTFLHDPAKVKLWDGHNRDYERLSENRCRDLIDSFKRVGKQEFPAIVRKREQGDEFEYELVCGARRHWTASYLGWELLVEVRELTDRQAFILQDIENRDREDISDFERAQDYLTALPKYFENKQSHMAKFLEIDKSNFGKLLELTKVPPAIVSAYADIRELKTHHGSVIRQLMDDAAARRRVLDRAQELSEKPVSGKQVIAELKKAAQGKPLVRRSRPRQFGNLALLRESASGKLAIDCQLPVELDTAAIEDLKQDFDKLLTTLIKPQA